MSAVSCSTLSEAQTVILRHPICLVFSDYCLVDGDIHHVFVVLGRSAAHVPVIVICREGDWEHSINALNTGVLDYIEGSWPQHELQRVARYALSAVSVFAPEPPTKRQDVLGGGS